MTLRDSEQIDTEPVLETVERISTTEQVLQMLRAAIIAGRIRQGAQLREAQLAKSLGTGRGAVREALRQLIQERLVEHEVHRGAFVTRITAADVLDVYRAREAVETAALQLALGRDDERDLSPLETCLARMRQAADRENGTWQEVADNDISFHESLVALGGSPRLVRMYSTLAAETRMHLYQYPPYSRRKNVEDHEEILEAIRSRADKAESLLRKHLRYSARLAAEWHPGHGE